MPNLFGLDLANIINDSISSAGGVRPGTLTQRNEGTRGSTLTAGTNPTTTTHSFQGFVETRSDRIAGSEVRNPMSVVSILGASVSPLVIPRIGDSITIDGTTWTLLELISRDPARALYEFRAET